jgi:hypothetical protein
MPAVRRFLALVAAAVPLLPASVVAADAARDRLAEQHLAGVHAAAVQPARPRTAGHRHAGHHHRRRHPGAASLRAGQPRAPSAPRAPRVAGIPAGSVRAAAIRAADARGEPAAAPSCQGWHVITGADGRQYTISPDNWGGGTACLQDAGSQAAFAITGQSAPASGHVLAYPDAAMGCTWGDTAYCTKGWKLKAAGVIAPVESLAMTSTTDPGDIWNFSNDLWFWPAGAAAPDCELMIYFDEQNLAVPRNAVRVTVRGVQYWYKSYQTSNASYSWQYIVFQRVNPDDSVSGLPLAPFFSAAIKSGDLDPSDDLQQVSAGFEVSQGGTGLRLKSFSVIP